MSAVDDAGNEYSLGFAGIVKSAMLDMVIMTSMKCESRRIYARIELLSWSEIEPRAIQSGGHEEARYIRTAIELKRGLSRKCSESPNSPTFSNQCNNSNFHWPTLLAL